MGHLDAFESHMENMMDDAAGAMFKSPLNPVQITKRAEKEMGREKLVSAGRQYAPTLYNVLVNVDDDQKLAGFYPTMAGEMETYLKGKASESGLYMDGAPLVRFIADASLKRGKFDVIAENVAAPIIAQLREEEMERYGLAGSPARGASVRPAPVASAPRQAAPRNRAAAADFEPEGAPMDNGEYVEDGSVPYDDGAYGQPDEYGNVPANGSYEDDYNRVPNTINVNDNGAFLLDMKTGSRYQLSGMRLSLGRERSNNISIRDANVSRSHAELLNDGNGWFIRDLGSTNGTYVNDNPVSECDLYDGDVITVGMTTLEFRES